MSTAPDGNPVPEGSRPDHKRSKRADVARTGLIVAGLFAVGLALLVVAALLTIWAWLSF